MFLFSTGPVRIQPFVRKDAPEAYTSELDELQAGATTTWSIIRSLQGHVIMVTVISMTISSGVGRKLLKVHNVEVGKPSTYRRELAASRTTVK